MKIINTKLKRFSFIILAITALILITSTLSKSKLHSKVSNKNRNKTKNKKQSPGDNPFGSYGPYSYMPNDPYYLQNQAGFKSAEIWPGSLPEHLNAFPYTGVFSSADTGIHNRHYYDGSINLAKRHAMVTCSLNTLDPQSCVSNPGCGWCGSSNTCVNATPLGPIDPCVRSTFLYSAPSKLWNPLKAKHINFTATDSRGEPVFSNTYEPDLKNVVNKPYALG